MATPEVDVDKPRPRTSTRDPEDLRARLERWMTARLSPGARPEVSALAAPEGNGMSSETLLFEAAWYEEGTQRTESLVARVAPDVTAMPVFPVYDLDLQFRVIKLVGELSSVPVPTVRWSEPDPDALGAPFFVMDRVEGRVPPDLMPYNFGSWLSEASPADQATLQTSSVAALAGLHGIREAEDRFSFLASPRAERSALGRHVGELRAYCDWVAGGGPRSPLLERCFNWLGEHWPEDEGPTVLLWGDSRIGNVLYRGFEPAAVLDWEMAALGPAEIDLGWFIFLHRFFEDLAAGAGLPGMPDFLRRDDVAGTYESLSGHAPRDLDFYTLYAALRHGAVMSRVQRRAIYFGEATMPDDVDDLILHRSTIEAMLAGTYWSELSGR
ncbi:MAG: phosphotransferase family protein [Actinomycetota bacterium]|nr:phosphotransferase family protein [Actinomycetota bacterium]